MKASIAAGLLALGLVAPAAARAETTITHVGGVEVIETQPDAVVHPHATKPSRQQTVPALAGRVAGGRLAGADALLRTALALVGTRYVWGGATPSGFDCSGFTTYAFAQLGIRIPRTADAQFAAGRPIAGDPLPGDLVFFQTYDYGASHVGIYLGNGSFVNAIGNDVHVASFTSPYFRARYLGARRFLPS